MTEPMLDDGLTAVGPCGNLITPMSLPKSTAVRWTPRRKAELVIAIKKGLIPFTNALSQYYVSEEEFHDWATRYENGGLEALMRTHRRSLPYSEQ